MCDPADQSVHHISEGFVQQPLAYSAVSARLPLFAQSSHAIVVAPIGVKQQHATMSPALHPLPAGILFPPPPASQCAESRL
jgi:hypothetical protein